MPGAVIVANQATGAGAGSPGVARNDLWQAQQVQLVDGAGGNSTWEWTLLDKPPGSAATLSGAATSAATFTPDLVGTYRVQLLTNGGGPGNIVIKVFRVRKDSTGALTNRGWAPPALGEAGGEANYVGNLRDWAEVFEFILADLLVTANSVVMPARFVVPGFGGVVTTQVAAAGGIAIGTIAFDPSAYFAGNSQTERKIAFQAILEVTTGVTAEIKLYNLDTAQVVTGSTLTSSVTSPTRVISSSFTIGASPLVPNTLQTYEIQLRISNPAVPGGGDFAICKGAHLLVSYD